MRVFVFYVALPAYVVALMVGVVRKRPASITIATTHRLAERTTAIVVMIAPTMMSGFAFSAYRVGLL